MKNPIKKILVSSLTALAFGAMTVGTTFALFTSQAKTSIEVEAGKVKVEQVVEILDVKELGDVAVEDVDGVYTNSIGGMTYVDEDNAGILHLEKWAPGDKVVLKITSNNDSNVTIKTRFNIKHTSTSERDLFEALKFTYVATDAQNQDLGYSFLDWTTVEPTVTKISEIRVTIEFPDHDDNAIVYGDANNDNGYQDLNCAILFTQEAVQGNAYTVSLLQEMNAALDAAAELDGKNETMYDALQDVADIIEEAELKGLGYVWGVADDHFHYGEEGTTEAYFKIYDAMPSTLTNSIYASSNWNTKIVTLGGVGFDAGESYIEEISYDRHDATVGKSVIIRTNGGKLTINAPVDTVKHYGSASIIDIQAVASSSYVEFGAAALAKIKTGRLVLTQEAQLPNVHVVETNGGFNGIKIGVVGEAVLPDFSRDDVELENGDKKLVIEVQTLEELDAVDDEPQFVWIAKEGDETNTAIATSGTVLDQNTIVESEDDQSEAAQAIALTTDVGVSEEELEAMVEEATRYAGGNGSVDYPYLIASEAHMRSFKADYVYADWWEDCVNEYYYEVVNDFTLTNFSCAQIYVEEGPNAHKSYAGAFFSSEFNGNGHTIKYVWRDGEDNLEETNTVTMFGELVGSVIKNLTIDCDIVTALDVGVISSYTYYGADISNVEVKGAITSTAETGGLVAGIAVTTWETKSNYTSYFENVVVSANITVKARPRTVAWCYSAPFIAQLVGGTYLHFVNCASTGVFTIESMEGVTDLYTGAFYGRNPGYADVLPENCSGNVNTLTANLDPACTLHVSTGLAQNVFNA